MLILVRYVEDAGYRKWAVHRTLINHIGKPLSERRPRYTLLTKAAARHCFEAAGVGDLAEVILAGAKRYPFTMDEMEPYV